MPEELQMRLENLSEQTGRTKAYYIKKALESYIEDQEDYLLCLSALEDKSPRIPFDKVRKQLGLSR
jgi:RHH-type rel operon transcriptional repressor/antitoxin RelB